MMMKTKFVSWIAPVTLLGMVGCSSADLEEPIQADDRQESTTAQEEPTVSAWIPGTPTPAASHADGFEHSLRMDWIAEEDSIATLTDHSALVISGEVESTRYDVIRSFAQSKLEDQPTGPESGIYTDLPVTIATVKIDKLARSTGGLLTPSGEAVAEGTTVDVLFAGGLLSDGCTLEPDDNPLPEKGEQTVLFLNRHADADAPKGVATPLATDSIEGIYAVTGGPMGRVLVDNGLVTGSVAPREATAIEKYAGRSVDVLLNLVKARAATGEYIPPEARPAPVLEEPAANPTALGWCGVPSFGYKWCRNPTHITFTDYAGSRWPVGDGMNEWMYTDVSNSLYLHWRGSGSSDVMVYEDWYGYNGWYGYAWNDAWNGCMSSSIINLNNTYHTGWHFGMTVATHEVGHSLGIAHHSDCNSIMYSNPTVCAASTTSCDAQAAAELYPY